jgi:hypothetical protein
MNGSGEFEVDGGDSISTMLESENLDGKVSLNIGNDEVHVFLDGDKIGEVTSQELVEVAEDDKGPEIGEYIGVLEFSFGMKEVDRHKAEQHARKKGRAIDNDAANGGVELESVSVRRKE